MNQGLPPVDQPSPAGPPPPAGPAYDIPPPPVSAINDWQKLSPRVLLLYPVLMAGQLIVPIVIAVFGFGAGRDGQFGPIWVVGGAIFAVVVGVVPWLTTRFRLTESQLQVRRGLLNKKLLTAPLDRVRSVDLESNPLHRILRLSKVSIGTGVDSTRIDLNALSVAQAADLQKYLLARKRVLAVPAQGDRAQHGDSAVDAAAGPEATETAEVELARINWSWLRYAPFSLASLVVVAGVSAFAWQFIGDIPFEEQFSSAGNAWDWVLGQAVAVLVVIVAFAVILGWLALSTITYVVSWWNLRLTRMSEGTLRLVRGLVTTNSTTVEEAKIRGVVMTEQSLLRLVGGAELVTLSTGVGDNGQTKVLPPCPRTVAISVGHAVLEEEGPLTQVLHRHGPYARRRCHVRAQWSTLFFTAAAVAASTVLDLSWWMPLLVLLGWGSLSVGLAEAAYRNLGHGLTEQHMMSGYGAISRTREVLERAGVIGWVIQQSFFQRRVGLSTLVATTAAGSESVKIRDIPLDAAIAVATQTTPEAFAGVVA